MYFILLLHMYSFLLLCKNTNQPGLKRLAGLSTGWQMFYAVVQASLATLLCITNMEFKIPYKVPHGPTYIAVL